MSAEYDFMSIQLMEQIAKHDQRLAMVVHDMPERDVMVYLFSEAHKLELQAMKEIDAEKTEEVQGT